MFRFSFSFQSRPLYLQINISIMQTAIVEEVISFSALDNMPNLTCPSLVLISLQKISMKLHSQQQIQRTIQVYAIETPTESTLRHFSAPFRRTFGGTSKKPKQDCSTDPFCVETVDTNNEELVACLSADKIHSQIRRLCNSSGIMKDAMLTDIPSHRSKVMFSINGCGYRDHASELAQVDDDQIGFIMLECGLEAVKFKLLKSTGHGNKEPGEVKCERQAKSDGNRSTHDELNSNASNTDDDVSWTSRISIPSQAPDCGSTADGESSMSELSVVNIDRNTTSGIIKVHTVWFNFAAPPRSPNTRKIDFTR